MRRLDLRTPESTVVVAGDTPAPLTADRLTSVRRAAGASLFSDGEVAPQQHDGWDTWARELRATDDRISELNDRLRHRSVLGWLLRRS